MMSRMLQRRRESLKTSAIETLESLSLIRPRSQRLFSPPQLPKMPPFDEQILLVRMRIDRHEQERRIGPRAPEVALSLPRARVTSYPTPACSDTRWDERLPYVKSRLDSSQWPSLSEHRIVPVAYCRPIPR
jgi:hypothetical protein